ncbi:MAG: hypothetical protein ACRELD_13285 [Longimicrobiales bacterium]
MNRRWLGGIAQGSLVLLVAAACSDSTAPAEPLTDEEAALVAEYVADVHVDGPPVSFATASSGEPSAAVTRSGSYEIVIECEGGGTITISGEHTANVDREAQTYSREWSASHVHSDCTFTRRAHTITLDGSVVLEGSASGTFGPDGRGIDALLITRMGELTWTSSDRTRTCEIDLTTTYDPETRTFTTTGTICGREVSVTRSR